MAITVDRDRLSDAVVAVASAPGARWRPVAAWRAVRYFGGVVALVAAYYAAGRLSLALEYAGPVAAIWLPSGLGAAVLYLGGLRWWPGLLIGDLALADPAQPLASALGITAGNMADMLVIAVLLRLVLGRCGVLDRLDRVGGALVAIVAGAMVTATVAVVCVGAGGVVGVSELPAFWRSWLLADASGSLVVIPLGLAWWQSRTAIWRGGAAWEGALVTAAVAVLSAVSLSVSLPLTYAVFPALIWAALRFGPRGATLAVAVATGMTVAMTANEVGAFVTHSITERVLATQLYIAVAALTSLCLTAIESERRRTSLELGEARARLATAGAEARRRVEAELHDTAQNRLVALQIRLSLLQEGIERTAPEVAAGLEELGREAEALGEELRRIAHGIAPRLLATDGLVAALRAECEHSPLPVRIIAGDIGLSAPDVETAVYMSCLESIQNASKHAGPSALVTLRLRRQEHALAFTVHDNGRGFDPQTTAPGGGITNLKDRIGSVGGRIEIVTVPGRGTAVCGGVPWPPRPN